MDQYKCVECSERLPVDSFYKNRNRGGRIHPRCKECSKLYDKRRRDAGYFKEYASKNANKLQAKWKVAYAIKKGILKRLPCEICGEFGEAHHEDYNKPLEVRWLCRTHHMEAHRTY